MMKKQGFILFVVSFLVIGFSIAGGIVVRQVTSSSLARTAVDSGGMALVTASAPVVQRQTLDLWPLLLTLRHLKAFSGFGWEKFYSQMAKVVTLPISAQPAALKKFAMKTKTDAAVTPAYRTSLAMLLSAIANRIQKGNLNIIIGTKVARAVPPIVSLTEFLKLGLLPKTVTASLRKTIASLPKLPVEEQMQKLAATALDLQQSKAIAPALKNIIWELHAITAFTLSAASQTALCTDLAGNTAPSTIAECNAQGGTVYDAQCPDITLFASEKKSSVDNTLPKLFPSASASGGNLYKYVKPDNQFSNCEKAVQYACVYSEIWKRPYTPGKYICGDFALDMKELLWNAIKDKDSIIRNGPAPTRFVFDKERYEEALNKARSGEGPGIANADFMVEQPMENPDPRVKITGVSTDLAPSLIHFFNDAECTDENGERQKIYFDAATCNVFDAKISETIFSEHVISEKNKVTGEAFMAATRKRKEEYATYWQKQRLEELRNPKPSAGQVGGDCLNSANFVCRRAEDYQYYVAQPNPNPGPGRDAYIPAYNNLVDEPNPQGSEQPFCRAQYFCLDPQDSTGLVNGPQLTCFQGAGCKNPGTYTPVN